MNPDRDGSHRQSRRSLWLWDVLSSLGDSADRLQDPVRQLALERLGLQPGDRVLDVGCGTGPNFEVLRDAVGPRGYVMGVDFSPKMVEHANRRIDARGWDNVEVIQADVPRAALGNGTYDAAISTFSLSAMGDVPAAVENVYAALRPGGQFFVCDLRLIPRGRSRFLIWLLGLTYKCIAGWSSRDVLTQLRTTCTTVDIVGQSRPWPPVFLAVAHKADAGKHDTMGRTL